MPLLRRPTRQRDAAAPSATSSWPRTPSRAIPVLEMVDAKLYAGQLDGYPLRRHARRPGDVAAWSRAASTRLPRELDGFAAAAERRHEIVGAFSEGELDWDGLDVARAWSVVMRGVLAAFYSHPWAWNEIGFGGPAYPRGYMRALGPASASRRAAEAFALDPVRDVQRAARERASRWARWPRARRPPEKRLGASCSTPHAARSPGASDMRRYRDDDAGRHADRRRRRRRLHARAAARAPGWRIVVLEAGPVLGPRRGLGLRRGRRAPALLDRSRA